MEIKSLQNQKGFTLVEIAIVLVIIGLLLGGVLKGQEIINSSKIKSDTDTLVGLQSAIYAYRDRMGYNPGSPRAAAPGDVTANKEQIVADNSGEAGDGIGQFFFDLEDQGFIKEDVVRPAMDDGGVFTAGYGEDGSDGGIGTAIAPANIESNKNYVCLAYDEVDNAEEIVRGIDIKLDDGDPANGTVRHSVDVACLEI